MLFWQNIFNGRQIAADTKEKLANQGEVLRRGSGIFTFPYQANGNHPMEPSKVGHLISEWLWKSTSNFTETVNNYGLK